MDHPNGIDSLSAHPTDKYDLVLRVQRPPPEQKRGHQFLVNTFQDRAEANRALKDGNEQ
jgi:hypothetical protein